MAGGGHLLSCSHRGKAVERVTCGSCSSPSVATVYACALHGACTIRRVRDQRGRTWRSCLACIANGEHLPDRSPCPEDTPNPPRVEVV